MKRKIWSLLLATAMVFSAAAPILAADRSFTDVAPGDWYAEVKGGEYGGADATAGIRDDRVFLHVVNTGADSPLPLTVTLDGEAPAGGMTVHEIAPEDPAAEVTPQNAGIFDPRTRRVGGNGMVLPPAAVAAVEIPIGSRT